MQFKLDPDSGSSYKIAKRFETRIIIIDFF